jgi:hypothetical protein
VCCFYKIVAKQTANIRFDRFLDRDFLASLCKFGNAGFTGLDEWQKNNEEVTIKMLKINEFTYIQPRIIQN